MTQLEQALSVAVIQMNARIQQLEAELTMCKDRVEVCASDNAEDKQLESGTWRPLWPHTLPDGYRQLADDEEIMEGDLWISNTRAADKWDPVPKNVIGCKVSDRGIYICFCRSFDQHNTTSVVNEQSKETAVYRSLGAYNLPDNHRQLAEHEVVQEGDQYVNINYADYSWSTIPPAFAGRVVSTISNYAVCRSLSHDNN